MLLIEILVELCTLTILFFIFVYRASIMMLCYFATRCSAQLAELQLREAPWLTTLVCVNRQMPNLMAIERIRDL